jgi:glutathione S-transferase
MSVGGQLSSAVMTILVLLFYQYLGSRVGSMRGKHNVSAPAMTGPPEFERAVRVHMNTLENLVVFLPLLWLATLFFRALFWLPALVGLVWLIGRILYMTSYMEDPGKRGLGFGIALIANVVLLVLAIWGIVQTAMALS